MTIQDSNPTGNKPQEIRATIDPMAVAQIVREMQKADVQAQPRESRFQSRIKKLVEGGGIDKDNLAEVSSLIEDRVADAKEEWAAENQKGSVQSMQSRYSEAISDALSVYTEGDDQLEYSADLLHSQALKKLAADPSVMAKFNANQMDKAAIKKAAKEAVEDFNSKVLKRDKSAKGPTIKQGIQGSAASQAIENSPPAGTIDDIAEPHRREAYFKLKALFERNKVPKEDAHKKAYAMATKNYRKGGSAA